MNEIFCKSIKGNTYRITNKNLTFLFNIINEDTLSDYKYYFQISKNEPWIMPKRDTMKIFGNKIF